MKALVYCEHSNGKIKKASLELLTNVANWSGVELHALVLGAPSSLQALTAELKDHGAAQIHLAEHSSLTAYSPEGFSKVVADAAKSIGADALLTAVSLQAKDFFPRAAVKLDTGMASDCIELSAQNGSLQAKRPMYSGKCFATVEFTGAKPYIASVRPNALGMKAKKAGAGNVSTLACDPGSIRTQVLSVNRSSGSAKMDLTEADRIVSGGRSLKSAENFKILEELAGTINGVVGASRAAVDAGFRPHSDQVGQTGKTVSPILYMAFGISGAIQHLAGMRTSKVIVAVNTDPNAPIFQKADYGVVADLFQLAPALKDELKKICT